MCTGLLRLRCLPDRPPELLLGAVDYTLAVDVWSVGCTIAELVAGTELFRTPSPGSQTAERLLGQIWMICGDATDANWPGHDELPLWEATPAAAQPRKLFEHLTECGAQLTRASGIWTAVDGALCLDPAQRLTAAEMEAALASDCAEAADESERVPAPFARSAH